MNAPSTLSAPAERLLRRAEQLVRAGQRPTVDLLVTECGGSRTTAQKALNVFWQDTLPRLLEARGIEDTDLPPPVIEAVRRLWGEAQTLAGEQAAAALQADRDAAKAAQAVAEARVGEATALAEDARREVKALAERLAERDQALAEAKAAATRAGQQLDTERRTLAEALAEIERARAERDRLADRLTEAQATTDRQRETLVEREAAHTAALDALRAQHEAAMRAAAERSAQTMKSMESAHRRAFDELRELHLNSEQRLRLELDAARTLARKHEKAAAQWQQRHAALDSRLRAAERRLRSKNGKKRSAS